LASTVFALTNSFAADVSIGQACGCELGDAAFGRGQFEVTARVDLGARHLAAHPHGPQRSAQFTKHPQRLAECVSGSLLLPLPALQLA